MTIKSQGFFGGLDIDYSRTTCKNGRCKIIYQSYAGGQSIKKTVELPSGITDAQGEKFLNQILKGTLMTKKL